MMVEKRRVNILIPIHNGVKETLTCLRSIYNSTYSNIEVIIIDDGSTDSSREIIESSFPQVKLIEGNGDLWWSGGMNEGLKYVKENCKINKDDVILLLNNDNIIQSNMIKTLVDSIDAHPNSIICSKVYIEGTNHKILFAGGHIGIKQGGLYISGYYKDDKEEYNREKEVEWCGGMGVAIPFHIINDVGYFDNQNFPQYFGDADYMYRARIKGYKVIYNPASICWNNREQTGFSIGKEKVTLITLKQLFKNIKSNYDIKTNFKFYFKYFNLYQSVSICLVKYLKLILSLFKKNISFYFSRNAEHS